MADPQPAANPPAAPATATSKMATWIKTVVGAAAGLFSGAVMMYLSPLVDRVVKPTKPVANFEVEKNGLSVTFHNRSAGGGEGWWDFGDGSALEPASTRQPTVSHIYANPGSYTAKLSLRTLFNEESDRTVNILVETSGTRPPHISSLDAVPVSPGAYAPATFRISSKSDNAELCIWDFGDDRPFKITGDQTQLQDQLVTYNQPGSYVIKLAVTNGKESEEKSTIIYVDVPPKNARTAILTVTEQATEVNRIETPVSITETFAAGSKSSTQPISRSFLARHGYEITSTRLEPGSGKGGKDLKLELAPDRRSVRLTGELVRDAGSKAGNGPVPSLVVKFAMTQEKRTPVQRGPIPVTSILNERGLALLTLPPPRPDWVDIRRQLRLEIREGDRVVFREAPLPRNAPISTGERQYTLSAMQHGDQVRIDMVEKGVGQTASAN